MSHHPRIEEISDSDSDPSDQDPTDFDPSTIIQRAPIPAPTRSSFPPPPLQQQQQQQQLRPQFQAPTSSTADNERHKRWQCLYPVYFDINRSRAEGRRVGKEHAVSNPLAREIVDAVAGLGLSTVFEPGKMHPKDWGNPGRVRCALKEGGREMGMGMGVGVGAGVTNKHHLYILVAKHLQAHPTTTESPKRLRIAGMELPSKPLPPPAVPRGWKINAILPLHSPALSGGGVSENIFKEMMQEMQKEQGGGAPAPQQIDGAEGGKKKKEKKKGRG